MKRIVLGALGVLIAAIALAPTTSAAQLPLAAPSLTAFTTRSSSSGCSTAAMTVTLVTNGGGIQAQSITIGNVPAACQGVPVKMTIFGVAGKALILDWPAIISPGPTTLVAWGQNVKVANIVGIALSIGGQGLTKVL
ncbi:MAG: hypothetical protein QOF36_1706 [Microbacteriaceae bacterium]|jgi:hypothetical protein|nr:hypothetical protein [Microbacteriaceae bacterium]